MSTQIGKAHVTGLAGAAVITWPDGGTLTGTVSRNIESLDVVANANVNEVNNASGEVGAIFLHGDYLEVNWNFIPDGATIAQAKINAALPQAGSRMEVSGFPVIEMGPFTDGLNTDSGNTQDWVVMPGARAVGSKTGPWTCNFTARRYINISDATPITT